jgi:hypothetical protein
MSASFINSKPSYSPIESLEKLYTLVGRSAGYIGCGIRQPRSIDTAGFFGDLRKLQPSIISLFFPKNSAPVRAVIFDHPDADCLLNIVSLAVFDCPEAIQIPFAWKVPA